MNWKIREAEGVSDALKSLNYQVRKLLVMLLVVVLESSSNEWLHLREVLAQVLEIHGQEAENECRL